PDSGFKFVPGGTEGTNEGINFITSKILFINHENKSKHRFRVRHHHLEEPAYGGFFAFGLKLPPL
ncbi:hypothetical protein RCH46_27920, partial [Serratia fonticola]|uniref:hypothetical protein n=1 Tax=Serratia fonticola TaxID=47917 RepID=UPI0027E9B08D